ncbi:hypothetical protein K7432_009334 [Basidiobolus ranarum]|uniref:HMG box domain-containing protein n=1 Tax=Basidiobolus ranarum TaxID=34480 RepID=A0ABR2WQN3_9FUNG
MKNIGQCIFPNTNYTTKGMRNTPAIGGNGASFQALGEGVGLNLFPLSYNLNSHFLPTDNSMYPMTPPFPITDTLSNPYQDEKFCEEPEANHEANADSNELNYTTSETYEKLPPKQKIPRPANCFFLFRKDKQAEIFASNPGITNMEVSRIIGKMWKNISVEEKRSYQWMAEKIKLDHQVKYPDYKYTPNRSRNKRKKSPQTPNEWEACSIDSKESPFKRQNSDEASPYIGDNGHGYLMNPDILSVYPISHDNRMVNASSFSASNYNSTSEELAAIDRSKQLSDKNIYSLPSNFGGGLMYSNATNYQNNTHLEPTSNMSSQTGFDFKWLLGDSWLES